ncbi:hypothetical protein EDC04DRAFT_2901571 [Pisolithus marmoratus]|nr:hypothetical protein EDC04DRAFT_2901571 [Pisolithus marmoratus]
MSVLVWLWILLLRLLHRVAATDSISKREPNGVFSDPPKQIAFTVCIVASIAGVLAVGVYRIVSDRRKKCKTSDDPELGSTATESSDNLLPSDQHVNSEPLSRAPCDFLEWARLAEITVPDMDAPKRPLSQSRNTSNGTVARVYMTMTHRPVRVAFTLGPRIPDTELRSNILSETAGHTGKPDEAEKSASHSYEEQGATAGLNDIVDLSPRRAKRVHFASHTLKQKRVSTRHQDTGPIDLTRLNKRSTHLVQHPAPILRRQDDTLPSVTEQQADMTEAVSATTRTA